MPVFLFNLQGDEVPLIDADGIDLPDLEAARMSAVYEAREIMKAGLFEGCLPLHLRFEITDQAGRTLLLLPFDQTVQVRRPVPPKATGEPALGQPPDDGARQTPMGWTLWLAAAAGAVVGLVAQSFPTSDIRSPVPSITPDLASALVVASLAWLRTSLLRY